MVEGGNPRFILLHVDIELSQHHLPKTILHRMTLAPYRKPVDSKYEGLTSSSVFPYVNTTLS